MAITRIPKLPKPTKTVGGTLKDQDVDPRTSNPKIQYKRAYSASKLPNIDPVGYKSNGQCIYSDEQLDDYAKSLPQIETATEQEEREKRIVQVELLLLKGVSSQPLIAKIIGVSRQVAASYIKAVQVRWELVGTTRNSGKIKGEALSKLSLLENECWALFSAEGTAISNKITILSNLQSLVDRKLLIHGLTPRVLEDIAIEEVSDVVIDDSKLKVEQAQSLQLVLSEATAKAFAIIGGEST